MSLLGYTREGKQRHEWTMYVNIYGQPDGGTKTQVQLNTLSLQIDMRWLSKVHIYQQTQTPMNRKCFSVNAPKINAKKECVVKRGKEKWRRAPELLSHRHLLFRIPLDFLRFVVPSNVMVLYHSPSPFQN